MKIKISPRALAKQLPELRLDILQLYDGEIILEGNSVVGTVHDSFQEEYSILKKYPTFIKYFTKKELVILSLLLDKKGVKDFLRKRMNAYNSNTIEVHIKNIRQKFKKHRISLSIETRKGIGFILHSK